MRTMQSDDYNAEGKQAFLAKQAQNIIPPNVHAAD
jgi:hypothetical protein